MRKTSFPWALPALLLPTLWLPLTAGAQDRIYRCGNEYTNNAAQAKERGCKLIEGGNVTVLGTVPARASSTKPAATTTAPTGNGTASTASSGTRSESSEQRARDADARAILEAELRKAEARLTQLRQDYNDGAPARTPQEQTNPQGYAERTAELKASVSRAEADVEGIRREITRIAK